MAWGDGGYRVRGLAVSAVAAGVLSRQGGVPADTVAKLLYEHDRPGGPGPAWRIAPGEVIVVDEASQLATADLARLVELTEAAHGKLVLIGDHRQLGAIEAGGLFRLVANDDAALTGVARFTHEWERHATVALRDRDTRVLDDYHDHDRLRAGPRDAMVDTAYQGWTDARDQEVSMVVMARDHATVDALAMRMRAYRVAAGEVEPGGLDVGDQTIGVGDEIVTLRNDRRLVTTNNHWVRNGDRWRVERRNRRGALRLVSLDGRGRVHVPSGYAKNHTALAYAVTLHKAQGMTVDHGIVLADAATSELGLYVGMTRGRHANHALVATDHDQSEYESGRYRLPSGKEVLAGILQHNTAERSATEVLHDTAEAEPRDRLSASIDYMTATVQRRTGVDSADIEELLERDKRLAAIYERIVDSFDAESAAASLPPALRGPARPPHQPEPAGPDIDIGP